jgi:hypothetical protein
MRQQGEEKRKFLYYRVNIFLSELRKGGWLAVEFDPADARERIYRLKSKGEIIFQVISLNKSQLTRRGNLKPF